MSPLTSLIKRTLLKISHANGPYPFGLPYSGPGTIFLCFHRINSLEHQSQYPVSDPFSISVSNFELLIESLASEFRFVSLSDAIGSERERCGCPSFHITFDDGYSDIYLNAFPFLSRLSIPFTVYANDSFILGKEKCLYQLLAICSKLGIAFREIYQLFCNSLTSDSHLNKCKNYSDLLLFVNQLTILQRSCLAAELTSRYGQLEDPVYSYLSPSQLIALSRHPLVTIGSHTSSHPNLAVESPGYLSQQVSESKNALQKLVGSPIVHFSYPYGGPSVITKEDEDLLRSYGFNSAATTFYQWRRKLNNFAIPRLFVTDSCTRDSILARACYFSRLTGSQFLT